MNRLRLVVSAPAQVGDELVERTNNLVVVVHVAHAHADVLGLFLLSPTDHRDLEAPNSGAQAGHNVEHHRRAIGVVRLFDARGNPRGDIPSIAIQQKKRHVDFHHATG